MGRPRKPTEKHLLDGTFRKDRHGPVPADLGTAPPPVKPADLTGPAGEFWNRVTVLLAGVVRDRDGEQLAELCRWWARVQKVGAALDKSAPGSLVYGRLMNQASTASATFDRIAKRFGMTPADRAAVAAEAAGPAKTRVATKPKTSLPPPTKKGKVK